MTAPASRSSCRPPRARGRPKATRYAPIPTNRTSNPGPMTSGMLLPRAALRSAVVGRVGTDSTNGSIGVNFRHGPRIVDLRVHRRRGDLAHSVEDGSTTAGVARGHRDHHSLRGALARA